MDLYEELVSREDVREQVQALLDAAGTYAATLLVYQQACRHRQDTTTIGAERSFAHDRFIASVQAAARAWGPTFPGTGKYDMENRSSLADMAVELSHSMMRRTVDQARRAGKTVPKG